MSSREPVVDTAERRAIRERAAEWLIELQEDANGHHAAFDAWVRQSPAHVEEFLFAATAWKAMDGVGPADDAELDQAIALAMTRARGDAGNVVSLPQPRALHRLNVRRVWPWAACLAAFAAVGVAIYSSVAPSYRTAVGEQRATRLADGSVLYLNTDSRVRVDYSSTERVVHLVRGEALFVVAPDAARPFRVRSGDALIQALGTQFNVDHQTARTTVAVLEGRISVTSPGRTNAPAEIVSAGEEVTVNATGAILKPPSADVLAAVAWRERRLVFRGETLEEIASEINRYGSRHFRVEGSLARQRRIAGTFSADDPEALVQFIRRYGDLSVETSGDGVIIRSR